MNIDYTQNHWFAAHTKVNQEFKIREQLDELQVVNFLPVHDIIREVRGIRQNITSPLIPMIIFLNTTYNNCFNLLNKEFVNISFIRNIDSSHLLIVPDYQMTNFIELYNKAQGEIEIINRNIKAGDKIRVINGPFTGIEGEIVRYKGDKRLLVRLDGLFSAASKVYIPKEFLRVVAQGK